MATLNKLILIGRLTENPEAPRQLAGGSTVVKFRFAVGKSKKNPKTGKWENDPKPLYIDCEAYSKDADKGVVSVVSQYCEKGKEVLLEGRLELDTWDDKTNAGQKRSKHKMVVDNIQLLGGGGGNGGGGNDDGDGDNDSGDGEPPF